MPRRKKNFTRKIKPDAKYNSVKIAKFMNYVMERGKKSLAEKIVYDAFEKIKNEMKKNPTAIFEQALKNVSPIMEIRGRRIGGANYQVPIEVSAKRKQFLAMNWIIQFAKKKKGPMFIKLAKEIMEASRGEGDAVKKKIDTHKMAEANRAFAHFA